MQTIINLWAKNLSLSIDCGVKASVKLLVPGRHSHKGPMGQWLCHSTYGSIKLKLEWTSPSGCWVAASARFQECLLHPWAHPCGPDGQMAMTSTDQDCSNELNLEWIPQWMLRSSACKVQRLLITPVGMPMWANNHGVAHLQAKMVPMN